MAKYFYTLVIIFLLGLTAQGQTNPRWNATASSTKVSIGEEFQVTFTLSNAKGSNFIPPDFKYFKVLGVPARGSSTTIINGAVSSSSSWTYRIRPEKTGMYWIKPGAITIDGHQYFTKKIKIESTKGKVRNATSDEEFTSALQEQVFIKAELSDTVAVVGQPLVFELKLYWIPNVLNPRLMAEPNLSAFYHENNPRGAYRTSKETIDGKSFNVKTLYRSIIYPQQIGQATIGSYRILVDVQDPNGKPIQRGFFTQGSYIRMDLRSKDIDVRVLELPKPAPPSFSGAVGRLDLQCKVDQRVVTTDDAVTLTMTIVGEGDTKQMEAPAFNSTDSLEVYAPRLLEETSFQTPQGIIKEKSFEYVLLPKYPGKYNIVPEYSYFDSDEMIYKLLSCEAIELRVSQGSNPIGKAIEKAPVIEDGLSGILPVFDYTPIDRTPMNPILLWSLLGLPIFSMLSMISVFYYRKNQPEVDQEFLRQSRARQVALSKLKMAESAMVANEPRKFYDELSKAMHGYLEDKIGIPLSSLNASFIREKLVGLQVDDALVQRFMLILENCQMALFAGKTDQGDLRQSYTEAGDVIEALEAVLS